MQNEMAAEVEKVKAAAHASAREHARVMQKENDKLENSINRLKQKCQELEEKEKKNQDEKTRLEQEKKEVRF